jgi:hypothetical protein
MSKTKRPILLFAFVVALLAIPTFVVFAKELGSLTIAGPGIKGDLTLSDHESMMNLEGSGFFDQTAFIKPPENLNMDGGYSITAHLNLDGKVVPFVQMVYYPVSEDKPGYVHYTGRLNGETLKPVDEWNMLSLSADKSFRELMTANNVTLQSALVVAAVKAQEPVAPAPQPAPAPAASPAIPTSYLFIGIAAVLLLAGAGLVIRRRTVSHTTT